MGCHGTVLPTASDRYLLGIGYEKRRYLTGIGYGVLETQVTRLSSCRFDRRLRLEPIRRWFDSRIGIDSRSGVRLMNLYSQKF